MQTINNGRRMEVERQPEWQILVEQAIKTAVSFEEADRRDDLINQATSEFLRGAMSADTYRQKDEAHQSDTRGHVLFSDIHTFQKATEWVLKKFYPNRDNAVYKARAHELVEHEKEHFQEAGEQGMKKVTFLLRFFTDADMNISFRPAITFELPKNLSDQHLRDVLQSIIEAPTELSDADENMVR